MRLIDLIRFIRTSSQMFYHQILTEYERLQLIKLAFPRQDLIKWFDSRAVFPIPPERYMPLLLMNAASAVVPRHMVRVHYGSARDLVLLRGLSESTGEAEYKEVIIDRSAAVEAPLATFARHDTGLIQGIVDPDSDWSAVSSALTIPAQHARRLCILPREMYRAHEGMSGTWQGFPVYSGILQYWPERVSAVVFQSYMPVAADAA